MPGRAAHASRPPPARPATGPLRGAAQSKRALEDARGAVAALVGAAHPGEVVFTACGTESNNWALAGAALAWRARRPGATPHVVASAVEHPAVTECLKALAGLVRASARGAQPRAARGTRGRHADVVAAGRRARHSTGSGEPGGRYRGWSGTA